MQSVLDMDCANKGLILGDEGVNVKNRCFPNSFAKNPIWGFLNMRNSDITFISHFDITKGLILGNEGANVQNGCFSNFFAKNPI